MNVSDLSDDELLFGVERLLGSQRRLTALLLRHLAEVEERRLHLLAACSSMFDFCLSRLGMSEGEAFRRVTGARTAQRFPVVLPLVESGKLHLSALCVLAKHLTEQNHLELFHEACGKSRREVEALVAARFPKPDVPSSIRKLPERASNADLAKSIPLRLGSAGDVGGPLGSAAGHTGSPLGSAGYVGGPLGSAGDMGGRLGCAAGPTDGAPVEAPSLELDGVGRDALFSSTDRRSRVAPLAAARYKVQFTAGAELKAKLERARNLLSHAHPSGDLALIVERGIDLLLVELERKRLGKTKRARAPRSDGADASSPLGKPESSARPAQTETILVRARARSGRPSLAKPEAASPTKKSRPIPLAARREVFERDGERCTFVDSAGRRCPARAHLELDHIRASALGGGNETENLRVYCRAHNRLSAELTFGRERVAHSIDLRQRKCQPARQTELKPNLASGTAASSAWVTDISDDDRAGQTGKHTRTHHGPIGDNDRGAASRDGIRERLGPGGHDNGVPLPSRSDRREVAGPRHA